MHNWLIVYNWLVLVFAAVGWCEVIWAGRVITFSPLRCESGEPRTAGATAGLFSYLASQTEHVYSFFSTLNKIGIYCWQIIPAAARPGGRDCWVAGGRRRCTGRGPQHISQVMQIYQGMLMRLAPHNILSPHKF